MASRIAIILALCLQWSSAIVLEGERYSYARYPPWNGCTEASFSFDFKTTQNGDAILWYADDLGGTDFFYVSLKDGSVRFLVNVLSNTDYTVERFLGQNLNDGRWHSVRYQRQNDVSIFTVDHMTTTSAFAGNDFEFGSGAYSYVYIGGLPQNCAVNLFSYSLPSVCLDNRLKGSVRNVIYNNCTCQSNRVSMVEGVAVSTIPSENCDNWNPCRLGCVCLSDDFTEPTCDCSRSTCRQRKREALESLQKSGQSLHVKPRNYPTKAPSQVKAQEKSSSNQHLVAVNYLMVTLMFTFLMC